MHTKVGVNQGCTLMGGPTWSFSAGASITHCDNIRTAAEATHALLWEKEVLES